MIQQCLFLLLSIFVLCYNLLQKLFFNELMGLPDDIQKILIGFSYVLLSIYLPWYFLKAFHFKTIKFFAYWGGILFCLLPFVAFYIVPVYVFQLAVPPLLHSAAPMMYGLSMIYFYTTSLYKMYDHLIVLFSKVEIVGIFFSLVLWSLLPIIMYFGIGSLLENFIVNFCFILLTILLLKKKSVVYKLKSEEALLLATAEIRASLKKDVELCLDPEYNFTAREKEIIGCLIKGMSYKEIGEALFISDRTVGKHVTNIYAKAGVNQRADLLEVLGAR